VPVKSAYSVPELKGRIFGTVGQRPEPTLVPGPATSIRVEPQLFPSTGAVDQSESERG
jgi:hypothetical protein